MSEIKKYVPEGKAWLRAAVSAIPMAGGALDHLLFDKADAIRVRNMEAAIFALSNQLENFGDIKINKDWFSSEEALAAFKILSEKASYEPVREKVDTLGRLVATCGTIEYAGDSKKLSVLEHLSRLSYVQIKLLSIMLITPSREKKFSLGDFEQSAKGIWLKEVIEVLNATPAFWEGNLNVIQEFEILESLNAIRRIQLIGAGELGFTFTAIGKLAANYVHSAGL